MNVNENPDVPAKFSIRDIPTLMLFKGREVVSTLPGARLKRELTAFLDAHL